MIELKGVKIEKISAVVPRNIITNNDNLISSLFNERDLKRFEKTTGISERRHVLNGISSSDLGFEAAKDIIRDEKQNIGTLLWVSQTSDYIIPFTSNILQDKLELSSNTLCIDISAGCAGFVQSLYTAFSMAKTSNKKVLLIISETLSKILSEHDRSTTPLFGDGASALLISKTDSKNQSYFDFYSDGGNFDAIKIPDGGFRNQFNSSSIEKIKDENGNIKSKVNLHMNGSNVFDFTLREIPNTIKNFINKINMSENDIDFLLLHQSNKLIINQIRSLLKFPKEKVLLNIHKFGNTSGVSIPLLIVSEKSKLSKNKSRVICCGYGSGLNWGSCYFEIENDCVINKLKEI